MATPTASPKRSRRQEIQEIRAGYPWHRVDRFSDRYGLRDAELARLLGTSERTLSRLRRRRKALDPVASDRFFRLRNIIDLTQSVLEDGEGARSIEWLRRPQPGLGGRIPLDILDTHPGAEAVERLLGRLEYGVLP